MKACLTAGLAISVSAVSVDYDDEAVAFPVQVMQSIHNHEYHMASSYDKIVS